MQPPAESRIDLHKVKVFISYARQDMVLADRLVEALESHGFPVTIDRRDLPYGEEWQKELQDFIQQSDTVVWLISQRSIASRWCNWELSEVLRLGKRLVPVRLQDVDAAALPPGIGKIHILPATGLFVLDCDLDALVQTLETDRAWVKHGTRLGDQATQWEIKGKDAALLLRGRALTEAEQWSRSRPPAAPAPRALVLAFILASRNAAAVRLRSLTLAAVAAAILATGLAAWALVQQRRAEATLEAAAAGANALIGQVAVDLRYLSGVRSEQIRKTLDSIHDLQDRLARAGPRTAALEESEGRALVELAMTRIDQADAAGAVAAADQAIALSDALARRHPGNAWVTEKRYQPHRVKGDALQALGREAEALAEFERSLVICEASLAANPLHAEWRRQTAASRSRVSSALAHMGRKEEALELASKVLDEIVSLARQFPQNRDYAFDEAAFRNNHALVLKMLGRLPEALSGYAIVEAQLSKLTTAEPTQTRWRRALGIAAVNVGDVLGGLARNDDQRAAYLRALGVREELAASDPSNIGWQADLALVNVKLAEIGDRPRERLSAALDLMRRLERGGRLPETSKHIIPELEAELAKHPE